VKKSKDIRKRLSWRMDAWGIGLFDILLVQTTERDMRTYLSTEQGEPHPSGEPRSSTRRCCEEICKERSSICQQVNPFFVLHPDDLSTTALPLSTAASWMHPRILGSRGSTNFGHRTWKLCFPTPLGIYQSLSLRSMPLVECHLSKAS
jgi:hypothetical protein